ncbi:MAG: hypothetical protein WA703_06670, partial [Pseudolabrys sp.]
MSAPKLSNNILQKELAFIGHWSGTVVDAGVNISTKRPYLCTARPQRQRVMNTPTMFSMPATSAGIRSWAVAHALTGQPIGPGLVHRTCAELQQQ